MTDDARFEDGGERPIYLGALDADDLQVISSLVQDAVLPSSEIRWQPKRRRLSLLVNRLRREHGGPATEVERVQSLLVFDNALSVASQGVRRDAKDLVLSILSITFDPGEDASGHVVLTLAGDGAIRVHVEAIDVSLRDVTRPYLAPSGKRPVHPD